MAPNLKSIAILDDSLLSSSFETFRNSEFTLPARSSKQTAAASSTTEQIDNSSYWDWESDVVAPECESDTAALELEHVLSLAHIEANLRSFREPETGANSTNPESDAYWAESSIAMPQHNELSQPCSYWDEAAHEHTESDNYWNEAHRQPAVKPVEYWDEKTHEQTETDVYWGTKETKPCNDYWYEASHAQTDYDRYWSS